MKITYSAFDNDVIALNLWDVLKLLIGLTIKRDSIEISLW